MKSGSILFNGTNLTLYGTPRFTLARTPDPAPPARAQHYRVAIGITMELEAAMPATVWARAQALSQLMATTPEGTLEIRNENGIATTWLASPSGNNLGEAIRRGHGTVTLEFQALEQATALPLSLTVNPLDGGDAIQLASPTSWSEGVRIEHPDERLGHRSRISSVLNFTARTLYADPTLPAADRAAALIAEQERVRALSGFQAQLAFAGFDRTVQFESVTSTPNDAWEYLEVTAQARYVVLPGDSEAEVEFTTDQSTDPTTGETRIVVAGSIEAEEKSTAQDKLDAILAAYRTSTRQVRRVKQTDRWLDGEDAEDTPTWAGLNFEIELSEGADEARYQLKIDTTQGADGRKITYSGTAYAQDSTVLLATIATAAGGKHPVLLRSQTAIDWATDDEGNLKIGSATFSYEYAAGSATIHGTVQRSHNLPGFAERGESVTGSITADTYANARTIARGYIPNGVYLRVDDEQESLSAYKGSGSLADQFVTMTFTYGWFKQHDAVRIAYKDDYQPDYSRMVATRTISGTARAADAATAKIAVAALLTQLSLSNPARYSWSEPYEVCGTPGQVGTTSQWLSLDFSYTFETSITGTIGHDILEAQWSIERVSMVNHEPITEVPLDLPVKQGAFGYNIGRLTASGMVRARQQTTARLWGTAKRASVSSYNGNNGAEDPSTERMTATMVPFSGSSVAAYEFSFTYSFRYAAGITGTWPVLLTL